MPEELGSEQDVNQEPVAEEAAAVSESSPETSQDNVAEPPAEEHSAQQKPEVSEKVPYNRFKEVNDKAKTAEAKAFEAERRAKELEARLAKLEAGDQEKQGEQRFSKTVSRLKEELGMDDKAAEKLAAIMKDVSAEEAETRVQPVEQKTVQQEIAGWARDFSAKHDDYEEMAGAMNEAFSSLPERMQDLIAVDPKGLELLYGYAKEQRRQEDLEQARQKGAEEAYQTQRLKGAVSSTPAAAAPQGKVMTEEDLMSMPTADYIALKKDPKRWAEAMAQLAKASRSED